MADWLGKTIGRYKILEEVGRGGMGVVYRAEDSKLKRLVAIKSLHLEVGENSEERQRFVTEAQAAAALNHPNIATIYSIEEVDGSLFIVMELVEGKELRELIKVNQPTALNLQTALDYASQIAEGLRAAHTSGITHRDVKSSNIMVTPDGRIKIMDFGLAKVKGAQPMTKVGTTLGTTAYMSPEQVRGERVDHRTDTWSFGVVLYELLTGQLPFTGDYEQAVIYSVVNEEPEPISAHRRGLLPKLEQLVLKCLEKDPNQRYQTMDEVINDLNTVKNRSAGSADKIEHQKPRFGPRAPIFGFVGVVVVALAVIYSVFLTGDDEAQSRIPIAVVDFINETNEPELDGLSGMLITALEHSQRLSVLTRGRMFDILNQLEKGDVQRIDESLGREICRKAGIDFMAIASIRKFGEKYTVDLKLLDHQKDEYLLTAKAEARGQESIPQLIDRLAEDTRKGLKERDAEIQLTSRKTATVTTVNLEAYQHYFNGEELLNKIKEEEAISEFRKAIALDTTFGLAYYRLGYTLHFFGRNEEARIALSQAMALLDRMPDKEQYLTRAYTAHLGHTPQELEAGLAILREMEKRYPNDKEMIFFIGDWSYHYVQLETAREYLERVLTMDPDFRRGLIHVFLTYREMGEYTEALEVAKRMHRLSPNDDQGYWMLGSAYGRLAEYDSAIVILEKGLAVGRDELLLRELSYVHYLQEHFDEAEKVLQEALNKVGVQIWTKYLLAEVLLKQNRVDAARTFAHKAAVEHPGFHGDNLLAWVLASGQIDADQAIVLADKALSSKPFHYPERARAMPYFVLPEHTLGLAYLQKRQPEMAVRYLELAFQQTPLRQNVKADLQAARKMQLDMTAK